MIDIRPFHEPSHGNDWTLALNAAIDAATPLGESIQFPAGRFHFKSRPKPMGCGIFLRGDAGITSAKLGTMLVADYDESDPEAGFFTWDGTDTRTYKGSGGGISGMSLYRLDGSSGGVAIKLVCTNNTTFRAGWWSLSNVAVLAENKSTWDHCFIADGNAVPKEGIRWLNLQGFMASSAKRETVWLRNVIHLNWNGGQVQGGHTVDPHANPVGVLIEGKDSQDIILSCAVYGTLDIRECEQFMFNGLAKWIKLAGGHKVRRGIINAVGCDKLDDNTDNFRDWIRIIAV